MLKLELAGQTILYRNAVDLSREIQERLDSIREQRLSLEKQCKAIRQQERILDQFLHPHAHYNKNKEEKLNA